LPAIAPVQSDLQIEAADLMAAMAEMSQAQSLNRLTHAVHAAGFYRPGQGLVLVREDVGRHNALDKLAGAMARQGLSAKDGAILMTSRLSVELVQKAAAMGTGLLAAVSAPTALAIRTAQAAGMTLAGIVRADGLEVFTHPARVLMTKGNNHADR
jgi:FdhD protein